MATGQTTKPTHAEEPDTLLRVIDDLSLCLWKANGIVGVLHDVFGRDGLGESIEPEEVQASLAAVGDLLADAKATTARLDAIRVEADNGKS